MTTIADRRASQPQIDTPPVIFANIIWNALVAVVSIMLGLNILGLPTSGRPEADLQAVNPLYDLSFPVQVAVGLIALVPAAVAIFSIVQLLRRKASGRYAALLVDFVSAVVAGIALLHLWGIFTGMDNITTEILKNWQWAYGLIFAYALYWIAGRMPVDTPLRGGLEKVALAIGGIALIALLWFSNIAGAVIAILSTYANPAVIIATLLIIVATVLLVMMLRQGDYFGETPEQKEAWQGWFMLAPNIIGFVLFFAGPLLLSFYLSFTNDTVGKRPEVVGVSNYADILTLDFRTVPQEVRAVDALPVGYRELFSIGLGSNKLVVGAKDHLFWYSLRNTFLYCLLLIPLGVLPALGLSLILNSTLPGMKLFRAVYFLPSVAAVVGTALIWRWLYDPVIGYINYALTGLTNFLNGIAGRPPLLDPIQTQWLSNDGPVLLALVIMGAWQVIGFNTVLFLAGLQGVPKILYEAAYVDGAGTWGRFANVTLPLLAPTTFFVIITTMISGLQVFNEPYALISQRPMPTNATTVVYYLYNRSFFNFEFGYASAVAWILFIVIFGITLIQFRVQQRRGFESYTGG